MIEPGSRVLCVNDKFPGQIFSYANNLPRKGEVYTVAEIGRGRNPLTGVRGIGLILHELDNPWKQWQVQFCITRFVEQGEGIGIESEEVADLVCAV